MSSKCNGKSVSRRVRRQQLQRARSAVAIRANVKGIAERFGIERIGVMTLTFPDRLLDAKLAKRRLRSFRTGVLSRRYGGYLWVMERTQAGAIHFHVLVPTAVPIRPVGRATRELRRRSEEAASALQAEQAYLRYAALRYGFGRVELRPIRVTVDAVAAYFAKTFEDADPTRAFADCGARLFDISRNLSTANTRFSWCASGGTQWRLKLAAHVAELIEQNLLPAGAGINDLATLYGPAWALRLRPQLLAAADLPTHANGSLSSPTGVPPSLFSSTPAEGRCVVHHATGAKPMFDLPTNTSRPASPAATGHADRPAIKKLHPLCTAFPPIDEKAFADLVEDIQQNGLREPIVLLDDQVLDGRNRYHACLQAGVQARFRRFGDDRTDGADPVAFVLSKNLRRRHLTASQQAAAVAKTQDWSMAHPAHRAKEVGTGAHFLTTAKRAAVAGVGVRTQKDADLVAREAPELLDKVISGEVSVKSAARQVRACKEFDGGGEFGVPTAEDYDIPSSDDEDDVPCVSSAAKQQKMKAEPPADSRDARIAELEEIVADLREALEVASEEMETLKAAGVNEDAAREIRDLKAILEVAKSQSREWMLKCNELVRHVKALRRVIKRLETGR